MHRAQGSRFDVLGALSSKGNKHVKGPFRTRGSSWVGGRCGKRETVALVLERVRGRIEMFSQSRCTATRRYEYAWLL